MTIVTLLLAEIRICFDLNNVKSQSLSFDEKSYNVNVLQTKSKVTIVTLLSAVFSKLRLPTKSTVSDGICLGPFFLPWALLATPPPPPPEGRSSSFYLCHAGFLSYKNINSAIEGVLAVSTKGGGIYI